MVTLETTQNAFRAKIEEIMNKRLCIYCFKILKQTYADQNMLRCSTAKCRKKKA